MPSPVEISILWRLNEVTYLGYPDRTQCILGIGNPGFTPFICVLIYATDLNALVSHNDRSIEVFNVQICAKTTEQDERHQIV